MTITLRQAKALKYHTVLHHVFLRNVDGTPSRWRVNGKVKTWKRSPQSVRVPLKHGLRNCAYLTEDLLADFCLTAEGALEEYEKRTGK